MAEMTGNWKDILKAQNEDLARLETMNENINSQSGGSAKAHRRDSQSIFERKRAAPRNADAPSFSNEPSPYQSLDHDEHYNFGNFYGGDGHPGAAAQDDKTALVPEAASSPVHKEADKAPETGDRYAKAKVKLQAQQLQAAHELKLKMEEETRDLQRQLKQERENSKQQKSRIQQLELEQKRSFAAKNKMSAGAGRGAAESVDELKAVGTVFMKYLPMLFWLWCVVVFVLWCD